MSNKTTIVNGAGFVLGVPGIVANVQVTTNDQNQVLAENSLPVSYAAQPADVALVSPPATTTANVDTPIQFIQRANHIKIQNTSPYDVYVAYDQVATVGNMHIPPMAVLFDDVPVTIVHVYTSATLPINGNTIPNIYIEGVL